MQNIPDLLIHRIDSLFGAENRDQFIRIAVEKELVRCEIEAFDLRDPIEAMEGVKWPLPSSGHRNLGLNRKS